LTYPFHRTIACVFQTLSVELVILGKLGKDFLIVHSHNLEILAMCFSRRKNEEFKTFYFYSSLSRRGSHVR
jgi:hypothetical protein